MVKSLKMPPSDSDSDSGWNETLIAVCKKRGKTKTISEKDRIKQIQGCLDEDADIDTVDGSGNTALHTAVKKGYQMVAEFLRKAGARTDIPNRKGQTAILLAKNLGKQESMCTLNEPSTSRNTDLSSHNPSLNPSLNSTIRKRTVAAQDSSSDGSLIKMRLINTSQANPQRDVVSAEQRSNRKRTADDELVKYTKRLRKMSLTAGKEPHAASGLKRSLHGTAYQLKHLMLIMHRARELNYSFKLATEMDMAEKFDDVVLRYRDSNGNEMHRFLQAKHKQDEDKAISAKDLADIKNGDFSLVKYFVSWRKIEGNPIFAGSKSKDFILCTNIGVKVDDLGQRDITVVEKTETDNLLNVKNVTNKKKKPRCYKLVIGKSSSMWKTLKSRSGGKVTDDDEISRFLDKFILAVNQPNEIELDEIIERDIGTEFSRLDAGIVRDSFQIEIFDWFKTKDGTFLTDVDADEFFKEMKGKLAAIKTMAVGLDHMEKLEELGIRFNGVNTIIQNFISHPTDGSKQLLEIISPKQTLLTALLVCQILAQTQKLYENEIFTFVRLKTLSRPKISQLVLQAFEWSADQNLLIVDCESVSAEQYLQSLWNPICDVMAKYVNKKMILITQSGKDLGSECYLDRETCRVNNTAYSFENLTNESQKKLLGKQVTKFQGTNNGTNFAELLDIPDWDNLGEDDVKDLSNIMDTDSLVDLISEDELQIGRELDGLEDVGDYYVSRTIFRRVVIKKDILKEKEISDLLVISGIDGKLFGETNFNTLARNKEKEQFDALCEKHKDRNVHWLKKEQEKYIWEKSQGVITYLVQHKDDRESIHTNEMTGVTNLNEHHLTAHNEPVIISDTAGMGKSTMLTYLASEIKEHEPDMLVLKINLTHFSTALAEVKETPSYDLVSIDGAIKFLVEKLLSGETNFSRKVFKRIIERNHRVALIFDGFDEISPTYEKTVIDMLQTLANYGIRKLLVATRPHTRGPLEARLNAFSFEIRPFSPEDQERFLTSFWGTKFEDSHHDLNPAAQDRIKKYTVAIMKTLANSINDHRNKFTGNPLQAKLVAEVFERHKEGFQEKFDSCKDFIASEADEPKFPKKINLIYLYEHLVMKKFEIFFKKRGGNLFDPRVLAEKEQSRKSYIAKHETLALYTLFDKDIIKELQLSQRDSSYGSPDSTDLEDYIERDGIITQFIDGQPRFGHRTYAEYFAATFFSKILKRGEPDESFGKILVAHVLLEKRYETMRAFINWLLSDEYSDTLQGEFWTLFVKEQRSQRKETIFHLAAAEGNGRIIRIFLNCCGANEKDREAILHARDSSYVTAVHRAVEHGHLDEIKLLTEDTDSGINLRNATGLTPFHRAAQIGALDIVKYFIKEKNQNCDDVSLLFTAAYSDKWHVVKYLIKKGANINPEKKSGFTLLHRAAARGKLDIADYFLKKEIDVNSATNDGETPLHTAARYKQWEMVNYLLEKGANINSRMNSGWTLLHAAAEGDKLEIAEYSLKKKVDVNSATNDGETPLYTAARYKQWEMVKYLLEKGANIDYSRTSDGWTLLHVAVREGKLDIVDCLLEKKADVNLPTNDGETPLLISARYEQWQMFEYLLKKGANVNSQTADGETLLHAVADGDKLDIADYLVKEGVDVNSAMNDGETPLHTAARYRQWEMVKYLLENGANINSQTVYGETLLHAAAEGDELDIADYLLEKGVDVNSATNDEETPLYTAAEYGQWEMVENLLKKGANIHSRTTSGLTLLHAAAHGGELNMVECFLKKGVDVNSATNDGETPLYTAAHYGRSEMVNYLLENGAHINSQTNSGSTLLHAAAHGGDLNIVDYFLKKGVDINSATNDGETPMFTSARYGNWRMVEYFLEKGADINFRTKSGLTLLHAAARGGKSDIADYLLEKEVDVNSATNDGKTPLYSAAQYGQLKMVMYFLKKGANIDSRTTSGLTLLHAAARGGRSDIADYLLEKGADVNLPTYDGETPLYTAAQYGRMSMFKYFLRKGANIDSRTTSGLTLLHAAARGGKLNIADYLLKNEADVNWPTNYGETPLYTAAESGQLKMVEYLVENRANIDSQSSRGWTALDIATNMGHKDVGKYLLGIGATGNFLPTKG